MLGPGNDEAALSALQAYPGGMQVGGGINPSNAKKWLDGGASHVIVTSYIFEGGKLSMDKLKELFEVTGKDKLVLDLSCRKKEDGKYYVVTDRWQTFTDLEVDSLCARMRLSRLKEREWVINFVGYGGELLTWVLGIEEDLVRLLGEHCNIPCTYAGGADLLSDLDRVKAMGKGKVDLTIGSALDIFGGPIRSDVTQLRCRCKLAATAGGESGGGGAAGSRLLSSHQECFQAKGGFGGFGRTYS
eukprot:762637-Hanusia_phi.AAC.7